MSSFIVDDDFEVYSLGTQTPFGPWQGTGLIVSPGVNPSPTQCCAVGQLFTQFPVGVKLGIATFYYKLNPANITGVALNFVNTLGFNLSTDDLIRVIIEQDLTISLTSDNGYLIDDSNHLPSNSIFYGFNLNFNKWYTFQVTFSVAEQDILPGPIKQVVVTSAVYVDGVLVCQGGGITFRTVPNLPTGTAVINGADFRNPTITAPYGPLIDNVTIDSDPTIKYPHPATPPAPDARISSEVLEIGHLSNPNVRVSQMPLEIAHLSDPNGRVSAMVIEIIGNKSPSGWLVKES